MTDKKKDEQGYDEKAAAVTAGDRPVPGPGQTVNDAPKADEK